MSEKTNNENLNIFNEYFGLLFDKKEVSSELQNKIDRIVVLNREMVLGCFEENDSNYRLAFYINIYIQYRRGFLSDLDLEWAIHSYNQSECDDKAVSDLRNNMPDKDDFHYFDVSFSMGVETIYLDQNVISNLYDEKYQTSLEELLKLCGEKIIFYSPNHLEEVNRIPRQEKKDGYIDFISKLTKNIVMLPTMEGYCLKEEVPIYSLQRVNKSINASIALQKQYALQRKNGKFLFPEYHTDEHKERINDTQNKKLFNSNIFNDLADGDFEKLSQAARGVLANKNPICSKFTKLDFNNIKSIKDRGEFIHKIKTLMIMMDLYGYKLDKNVKDGALYDPEHLCYALNSDYFITDDNKLNERAKQIVNFLKVNTKIFNYNEFISFLKNSDE